MSLFNVYNYCYGPPLSLFVPAKKNLATPLIELQKIATLF